jgi:hypothetical protein
MDVAEAEAVNILLRWLLRLPDQDGSPVGPVRGCEAALMLSREARGIVVAGLGPEKIALPLGDLIERLGDWPVQPVPAEVPTAGIISLSDQFAGAATLVEAARRARELADVLDGLAATGCQLETPIYGGWGFYSKPGVNS